MLILRRLFASAFLILIAPAVAFAQWDYVGYAQTTVNNTAGGVALDASKLSSSGHLRPSQVFCLVEDADIRWTVDGTAPTTTVGNFAAADTALPAINGTTLLANFRAIRTGGSNALLSCTYFAGGSLPFREWGGTTATASGGGGGGGGGLTDTELRATPVPVSGSFYQATQPVSGTFWQATQPVSGTFYQATQPVSIASAAADSCADAASVLTKIISIASGTTTELVAISGSTTVTVCGIQVSVGGAVNLTLKRGTGSACGTGTTAIGPAWHFAADGDWLVIPPGNKVVSGTSGNAICLTTSAGSSVEGLMQYTQQ